MYVAGVPGCSDALRPSLHVAPRLCSDTMPHSTHPLASDARLALGSSQAMTDVRRGRVSTLIEEIGFTPIDTGSLAWGVRLQEPGSKIFNRPMLPAEARRILSLIG